MTHYVQSFSSTKNKSSCSYSKQKIFVCAINVGKNLLDKRKHNGAIVFPSKYDLSEEKLMMPPSSASEMRTETNRFPGNFHRSVAISILYFVYSNVTREHLHR